MTILMNPQREHDLAYTSLNIFGLPHLWPRNLQRSSPSKFILAPVSVVGVDFVRPLKRLVNFSFRLTLKSLNAHNGGL